MHRPCQDGDAKTHHCPLCLIMTMGYIFHCTLAHHHCTCTSSFFLNGVREARGDKGAVNQLYQSRGVTVQASNGSPLGARTLIHVTCHDLPSWPDRKFETAAGQPDSIHWRRSRCCEVKPSARAHVHLYSGHMTRAILNSICMHGQYAQGQYSEWQSLFLD